jgi:hypothetical protein
MEAERDHGQIHLCPVDGATTVGVEEVEDLTDLCLLLFRKRYMVALDSLSRERRRGRRAELGPGIKTKEQVPDNEGPVEADL